MKLFLEKYSHAAIYLILSIALLLRLQHITQPFIDAFSWRQTSTAMMAENFFTTNSNIFYPQVNWSGPGPSYQGREFQTISYLSALLYQVVGQQDWIGRIVAIMFGLLGIFALYHLVRRVWDQWHALAAALIMALMPASIFIERSFLPDPAMVALVTSSLWMLVAYLQTDRKLYLFLAALLGCLGFLTKIPGMIVGLPMLYATVTILKDRNELSAKRLWPLITIAFIALLPVVAYYLWARHLSHTYPPYHFAGSGNWIWDNGFKKWLHQKYFLKEFKNIFIFSLYGFPILGLVFLALLFPPPYLKSIKSDTSDKTVAPWIFHMWLAGCIFYYFIGAKELIQNMWNFHLFSPVLAVFAGRALIIIVSFQNIKPIYSLLRTGIIILIIFISSYLVRQTLYTPKSSLASYKLGNALHKISHSSELVITLTEDIGNPLAIYYSRCRGWVFPPPYIHAPTALPKDDASAIKSLDELRKQGAVWFGIDNKLHHDLQVNHPRFYNHIISTCRLQEQTPDFFIYRLQHAESVSVK